MWEFDVRPSVWPDGLAWRMKSSREGRVTLIYNNIFRGVTLANQTRESLDVVIAELVRGIGSDYARLLEVNKNYSRNSRKKQKRRSSPHSVGEVALSVFCLVH